MGHALQNHRNKLSGVKASSLCRALIESVLLRLTLDEEKGSTNGTDFDVGDAIKTSDALVHSHVFGTGGKQFRKQSTIGEHMC